MSTLRKIVYGAPTDKCAITVRLGIERGVFEEEGLDLSVRVVFGGPEIAAAYDTGEMQIGEFGSPPAIDAIAAGKKFKIVGSGCRQRAHLYFGVRKDIESFAGLHGTRIGVLGIGSCSDWITRKILISEGLDPDRDVTLVPLLNDYPRMIDLIEEGRLDACLGTEPILSHGEEEEIVNVWAAGFDEPYLPHYQWIVRVARTELIENDPELVSAVLRGCRRSAHYAAQNIDEWETFSARQFGISEQAARRAVERELPRLELDCGLDMAGLQTATDLQYTLGGIKSPARAEDLVDLRFLPDGKIAA